MRDERGKEQALVRREKRRRGRPRSDAHEPRPKSDSIPDGFYDRDDVRAALARYDFGTFFSLLRSVTGWTQTELGQRLDLPQPRISDYERFEDRVTDVRLTARIARALAIPTHLVFPSELDPHVGGAEDQEGQRTAPPRSGFLRVVAAAVAPESADFRLLSELLPAWSAVATSMPGTAEIGRAEHATLALREACHRGAAAAQLPELDARLRRMVGAAERSGSAGTDSAGINQRLLMAIADLASVLGWAHYDLGRHESAQRLWEVGVRTGRGAGRPDLVAAILRLAAHQSLHLAQPVEALRMLQLAQTCLDTAGEHQLGSASRMLLTSQLMAYQAWCYATLGKAEECQSQLAGAWSRFESAGSTGRAAEPWLASYDRVELTALAGHCWHALARARIGGQRRASARRAMPLLSDAVRNGDPGRACSATVNMIAWSAALFDANEVEQAAAIGHHAVHQIQHVASRRVHDRLAILEAASRPYSDTVTEAFRSQLNRAIAPGT
jgi:transcriptional regulator with XRE-family HTH domain